MSGDGRRVMGDGWRRGARGPALALVVAGAVLASPVAGQSVRVGTMRQSAPDSAHRDSIFMFRVNVQEGDLMRLIGELMASRQVEERVALTLRDASDEGRARGLEQQLQMLARRNAVLASTIRLQCARDDMQPEGFMGVNFVGIEVRREGDGPAMYYFDSTRIVSVDPGSPAQRGGIEANDEVLAIGGMEVSRPIPLGRILKPGARLPVRVLRAGRARDLMVVVGKRTDDAASPCSGIDDVIAPTRTVPQISVMRWKTPDDVPPNGGTVVTGRNGVEVRARSAEPPDGAAMPVTGGFVFLSPFASSASSFFAGAQLVSLDANWKAMAGVEKGLLVSRVAPGSPAENAGLKTTDIITAVGETEVTTIASMFRLMDAAGPNGVALKVIRAKQPITIMYRTRR